MSPEVVLNKSLVPGSSNSSLQLLLSLSLLLQPVVLDDRVTGISSSTVHASCVRLTRFHVHIVLSSPYSSLKLSLPFISCPPPHPWGFLWVVVQIKSLQTTPCWYIYYIDIHIQYLVPGKLLEDGEDSGTLEWHVPGDLTQSEGRLPHSAPVVVSR